MDLKVVLLQVIVSPQDLGLASYMAANQAADAICNRQKGDFPRKFLLKMLILCKISRFDLGNQSRNGRALFAAAEKIGHRILRHVDQHGTDAG